MAAGDAPAGGETPDWPQGKRYALHHAIIAGDTAYGSWRDGGLTLLDIKDRTQPRLISHRNWSPPFGGGTHTALPLPDRDLLVVLDEAVLDNREDGEKLIWLFDIREPTNPVSIAPSRRRTKRIMWRKGRISVRTTCMRTGRGALSAQR